ncbi:hypothetical protein [Vibrio parahaemolyticus]|uniref:hypothetical protein n=1 Tax=Vibrio parahaemolyticus TaxID=670 RepID=UPI00038E31A8|nr:hypothetical protein [Vibrio parahaemolyticus]ANQ55894.1 hypothetical protein AB831_06830 [Vibrio parahaemolyticus]ASO15785.1 hypothetical protein BGM07_016175 [Vibrio parahaemolyticus]AWA89698.1 hypothetical protein BSG32_11800 [Vibrio parahaemolyticus]EGQ7715957.1 hypothetical protein [Vibrio parahaemolyticus]EGQ7721294.1 hypothetical protein [Vibrio parahaemolyticus]
MNCKSCCEEISPNALKCKHCGDSQTISRFITPALSLVLALVSILAIVAPQLVDALNPDEPDINVVITSPAKMSYDEDSGFWAMYFKVAATNQGEIAGVYNGAVVTLKLPDNFEATGRLMLDRSLGARVLAPNSFTELEVPLAFEQEIPFLVGQLDSELLRHHFDDVVIELYFEAFDGTPHLTSIVPKQMAYTVRRW